MVAAGNTGPEAWIRAFDARSDAAFGEALAKDVQLDASVMRRPVRGRHDVAAGIDGPARGAPSLPLDGHEGRHVVQYRGTNGHQHEGPQSFGLEKISASEWRM